MTKATTRLLFELTTKIDRLLEQLWHAILDTPCRAKYCRHICRRVDRTREQRRRLERELNAEPARHGKSQGAAEFHRPLPFGIAS